MKSVVSITTAMACLLVAHGRIKGQEVRMPVGIQSDSVWERVGAFKELEKASTAFTSPTAQRALVVLLERENAFLAASERPGERSVGERYGEAYSEYYAELIDACAIHCSRSQPRNVRALVNGVYNSDSPFALDLARRHGPVVVAAMTENVSRTDWNRGEHLQMMALAARESPSLTAQDSIIIRQAAVTNLTVADAESRASAVSILAEVGRTSDLPLLDRLAKEDPFHYRQSGRDVYPVREAAEKSRARVRLREVPAPVVHAQTLAEALAGIQSADQRTRLKAAETIWNAEGARPGSICGPAAAAEVQRSLIVALERANAWRESPGPKPDPVDENGNPSTGEHESEFYARLIGCVGSFGNPAAVRALVGAIATGRGATDPLIPIGDVALREVARIADDPKQDAVKRDAAIRQLGRFAGETGTYRLSDANRQLTRASLMAALAGSDAFMRRTAIGSLQTYSDPELRAAMRRIAENDAGEVRGTNRIYPTRDAARAWLVNDSLRITRRPP